MSAVEYPNKVQELYYERLGWCGCGRPEGALTFMRDVLRAIKDDTDHEERWKRLEALLPSDLGLSYLYMLDHYGLTEHGGSVYGCWLTTTGEEALAALECDIEKAMSE